MNDTKSMHASMHKNNWYQGQGGVLRQLLLALLGAENALVRQSLERPPPTQHIRRMLVQVPVAGDLPPLQVVDATHRAKGGAELRRKLGVSVGGIIEDAIRNEEETYLHRQSKMGENEMWTWVKRASIVLHSFISTMKSFLWNIMSSFLNALESKRMPRNILRSNA